MTLASEHQSFSDCQIYIKNMLQRQWCFLSTPGKQSQLTVNLVEIFIQQTVTPTMWLCLFFSPFWQQYWSHSQVVWFIRPIISSSFFLSVLNSVWNPARNGRGYNLVELLQHSSEVCCRLNNSGLPGELEGSETVCVWERETVRFTVGVWRSHGLGNSAIYWLCSSCLRPRAAATCALIVLLEWLVLPQCFGSCTSSWLIWIQLSDQWRGLNLHYFTIWFWVTPTSSCLIWWIWHV